MSIFKITCFMNEEPNVLFPLLIPLRFKWTENHSITWSDELKEFKIIPFVSRGR